MTGVLSAVIPSADVDHEPVVLTYKEAAREAAAPPAAAHVEVPVEPRPPAVAPLEELRRIAFEEGRREGRAEAAAELEGAIAAEREALEQAGAALEAERAALAELLGTVRAALERGIDGAEEACVEIAFAAACRVIGAAALTDEGLRGMVRETLREVRSRERAVVRVSPADYTRLAREPALMRGLAEDLKVELAPDERVTLGGCLIEAAGGTLDARLEVQLRQLADALVRARAAEAA